MGGSTDVYTSESQILIVSRWIPGTLGTYTLAANSSIRLKALFGISMSGLAQNVVYASLAIAGLIGLACLVDLIAGVPFGGQTTYDILFIISAGITAYLGIDCLRGTG